MKKTIYTLVIMVASMLAMTSCTHNNGDIGMWFGTWHVEQVDMDGSPIDGYMGNSFFQFQSTVFQLRYTDELHTEMQTVGRWEDLGNEINVTFPDERLVWVHLYGIDMSKDAVNRFKVESHSGKDLVLTLPSTNGHTYRYHLKKWGK